MDYGNDRKEDFHKKDCSKYPQYLYGQIYIANDYLHIP